MNSPEIHNTHTCLCSLKHSQFLLGQIAQQDPKIFVVRHPLLRRAAYRRFVLAKKIQWLRNISKIKPLGNPEEEIPI